MIKDPIYRLSCEINRCHFDLRLNDVSLLNSIHTFSISSVVNLNHWLTSGKNEISFHYWFSEEMQPTADFSAQFQLFKIDASDKFGEEKSFIRQFQVKYDPRLTRRMEVKQSFEADEEVFVTSLNSLVQLPDTNDVLNDLLSVYTEIQETFRTGNIDRYLKIARTKESDYARVYFKNQEAREQETKSLLTGFISDPDCQLLGRSKGKLQFTRCYKNRLVTLEDREGNPALLFADHKNNIAHFIPLYFGLLKNGGGVTLVR